MKYRTRKEIAALSLAEVLAELDRLKIEPATERCYRLDGTPDAQGVPRQGEIPAFLNEYQRNEIRERGMTTLLLEQQVSNASPSTLALWRMQLYQDGVYRYVHSLGRTKCEAQLKARHQELSTWDARNASRQDVEKRLIQAIETEVEREEEPA